ncbi:GMC family oxidoreductase [Microbaculum marinum]|uniref:GMC family oxidoreductase N-terminal domain-containing protein n=2 Tax=Microbaculum marinum TaxID=1764581 RepID=A0AAW9RZA2_9HYPH
MSREWDYIIVGAGSAGCVLAARLSEDPDVRVLVVEAGGWDRHPLIHMPLGWPRLLAGRITDWGYDTEPDAAIGKAMECARGKVVGGSSSTNAMAWVKGHPLDFDRWSAQGLPGWDHASLLPYFKRIETWTGSPSDRRGRAGPIRVEPNGFEDPICESFRETVASAGYRTGNDYNDTDTEGFSPWQTTRKNGRRASAARAYLHPARARPNLTVMVRTHVVTLLWKGNRAVGVRCRRNGREMELLASREVVLCGGAINSPQTLMLSGIGPADQLRRHGIACRVDLPGVGSNLQDHISSPVICARSDRGSLLRNMRLDRLMASLAHWTISGRGFVGRLPVADMGFLKVRSQAQQPDLQVMMIAGALSAAPWLPPFSKPFSDAFALRAIVLHPASRGHVRLRSSNPLDPPMITQNFLSVAADRQLLRDGLRELLGLTSIAPLSRHVGSILGPKGADDAQLDAHIAATAVSVHHPAGTCRMGGDSDNERVVDGTLRVVGVEGLRVVDASVMPDLTGGNINAPVMMIAEKAADLIVGRR